MMLLPLTAAIETWRRGVVAEQGLCSGTPLLIRCVPGDPGPIPVVTPGFAGAFHVSEPERLAGHGLDGMDVLGGSWPRLG